MRGFKLSLSKKKEIVTSGVNTGSGHVAYPLKGQRSYKLRWLIYQSISFSVTISVIPGEIVNTVGTKIQMAEDQATFNIDLKISLLIAHKLKVQY